MTTNTTMAADDKDNKSMSGSCQKSQATEVYTISSDAPYQLALDDPHTLGRNGGILHKNEFDFDVPSQKSWSSANDGVNVLGGDKPDNFNTWSQRRAAQIVNTPIFKRSSLVLILICSIVVAVRTLVPETIILDRLLTAFLVIFTCEVFLSAIFYQDQMFGWVVFDSIVLLSSMYTGDRSILVLRSFRLLRALRKASGFPELRWVVKAILRALPRIAIACGLMACSLLTFAIWFTSLYPSAFPRIDQSSFILFQMSTGGLSWSDTLDGLTEDHPTAWIPMILFVVVFRFIFWSLIIAVMCNAVYHANDSDQAWKSMERQHDEVSEVLRLERKVDSLQSTLSALLQSQASLMDSVHQLKDRSIHTVPSDETAK